jgi:hypothetical protein
MALQPFRPWTLFQFLNLYTVGRTHRTSDQTVARPLPTHRTTQAENKSTETSMPRVGFEPMIPVFERTKTVHALDRAATVIGYYSTTVLIISFHTLVHCYYPVPFFCVFIYSYFMPLFFILSVTIHNSRLHCVK